MKHFSYVPSLAASLALAGFSLALQSAQAQRIAEPASPAAPSTEAPAVAIETYDFELGRAVVSHDDATESTYTVAATRSYLAKQTAAKIRLSVTEKTGQGTSTHVLTVSTGKYKTVAQMTEVLAGIFHKFLDGQPANQEISKIGDLSHGGEIHFCAESPDILRYDWMTPGAPTGSTRFKRNDIVVFVGILTHPKAAN